MKKNKKPKSRFRKLIGKLFFLCLLFLIFCVIVNIYEVQSTKEFVYSNPAALPRKYTVLIPGAKVYTNSVSHVVNDRIKAAVSLVEGGKCQVYLVSGDHGTKSYDEVNVIKKYMQNNYGADESKIFLDHAGFSTYETMYRARDIFCVEGVVIVTQKKFAPRAAYIARKLGLDAVVYEAPEVYPYARNTKLSWEAREFLARVKAFFDVTFHAKPKYLGDQIPITGDPSLSWD